MPHHTTGVGRPTSDKHKARERIDAGRKELAALAIRHAETCARRSERKGVRHG
jgi:hypothetical protein